MRWTSSINPIINHKLAHLTEVLKLIITTTPQELFTHNFEDCIRLRLQFRVWNGMLTNESESVTLCKNLKADIEFIPEKKSLSGTESH